MLKTKKDLKEYIKYELGYPVIDIELDDIQIYNQIDKAVERFIEKAYQGTEEKILLLKLEEGVQTYKLPVPCSAVIRVLEGSNDSGDSLFSAEYHLSMDMIEKLTKNGSSNELSYYLVGMEYLDLLSNFFTELYLFEFNSLTNTIHFHNSIQKGDVENPYKALLVYTKTIDMDTIDTLEHNIFNHRWIKEYATALTKKLWGNVLNKYSTTLPGGGTINASDIINDAKEDIEKLELQLEEEYDAPLPFFEG